MAGNGVEYPWTCGDTLAYDHAEIYFAADSSRFSLRAINSQCFKCSSTLLNVGGNDAYNISSQCASIWTPYEYTIQLLVNGTTVLSSSKYTFGENGKYYISIDPQFSLSIRAVEEPDDPYVPLYILLGILGCILLLSFLLPMLQEILRPVTLSDLESTYRLEERETTDTALKLGTENNMNTPFLSANVYVITP